MSNSHQKRLDEFEDFTERVFATGVFDISKDSRPGMNPYFRRKHRSFIKFGPDGHVKFKLVLTLLMGHEYKKSPDLGRSNRTVVSDYILSKCYVDNTSVSGSEFFEAQNTEDKRKLAWVFDIIS